MLHPRILHHSTSKKSYIFCFVVPLLHIQLLLLLLSSSSAFNAWSIPCKGDSKTVRLFPIGTGSLERMNCASNENRIRRFLLYNNRGLNIRTGTPIHMAKQPIHQLSTNNHDAEADNQPSILLQINVSCIPEERTETDSDSSHVINCMERLKIYLRSFPFSAVLPVQPLQYLPSDDGVDVTFLRKKTQEKGSMDGGITISVKKCEHDDDDARNRILVTARRNSEGQTISKIFSEKLVILALVDSFIGGNNVPEGIAIERQRKLGITVNSIFHKWL